MAYGDKQTPETWFKSPEQRSAGTRMKAPYDKIVVGCDPVDGFTEEAAKKYDAIVNVSCSPCAYFHPAFPGQYMHWFPINEMGYWGLAPFYWIKKVLDFHYEKGHTVYLHCHAGAYRSPTFAVYWLVSRGHSLEEAYAIEYNNDETIEKFKTEKRGLYWRWKLRAPYRSGNINPNVIELYRRMREKPTEQRWESFAGYLFNPNIENSPEVCGSRHWSYKWRHFFRWYYGPTYKIERIAEWCMHYVEGCKVDRNWSRNGWHIIPREDSIAKLCQWVKRKRSALLYRLSKVNSRIYNDDLETPLISLS